MSKRILMNGNEAIGEGAIRGGCEGYFGYPITPQNELTAYMAARMARQGRIFIQAESEIAAINMVFGCAAAGGRAMTSSSSPGISLKQEGLSYIAGAELPMLIVNVQRGGPGLGNIAPSQADYFQAVKGGGHGDYHLIVLAPASVQEMHDFAAQAFDLADRWRNPVMILTDGRLGQMMEPVTLWEKKPVHTPKPWALTGADGRERNVICSYYGVEGVLEDRNRSLQNKLHAIAEQEVRYEGVALDDARLVLVAYGTSARLCRDVVRRLRSAGHAVGLLRPITLWPFPSRAIADHADRAEAVLVVEMSAGQLVEDVRLACNGRVPVHLHGRMGGGVPTVEEIEGTIREVYLG